MEHARMSLPMLAAPGEVSTFYSYKGGVGRTMAVANLGVMLARGGNPPVLMIDWDLEAPGLHHYFPGAGEGQGVLELFEACQQQLRQRQGSGVEGVALARAVLDAVGWEQYVFRVHDSHPLYLMRAGRNDSGYAERVGKLHWQALFEACPALFHALADKLAARFGHVLVDARSGRAESAGICTTLLPTRLVLLFSPGRQNLEGLEALVLRATTYRRSYEDEQRQLLVYPLPSRIDADDAAQRSLWRRGDPAHHIPGYQPLFERALAEAYGYPRLSLEAYFNEVALQHCRSLSCGEPLPALQEDEHDRFSLVRSYGAFLSWFRNGLCPWESLAETALPLTPWPEPAHRPHEVNNHHRSLLLEQTRPGYRRLRSFPPPAGRF